MNVKEPRNRSAAYCRAALLALLPAGALALAGCAASGGGDYGGGNGGGYSAADPEPAANIPAKRVAKTSAAPDDKVPRTLAAEQTGGEAYWVLPGPRELSPRVFGTPDRPKRLVEPYIRQAKEKVDAGEMPPSVPDLLDPKGPKHGLPLLVGLPMQGGWGRSMVDGAWTLKHGSPFGDRMKPLKGNDHALTARFNDRQLSDDDGRPFLNTKDSAKVKADFKDPQGNTYSVKIAKTFKPPIPGWQTEGGVLMNSEIGGDTGIFIPLLPRAYSHATVWGIGKIKVNDADPVTRVVVLFLTEAIRNDRGELALDEAMPLDGDAVQAHLLVPPIKPVPGMGPTKQPVPTAFKLPPKAPHEHQPFICVYYPEIRITKGAQFVRPFEN